METILLGAGIVGSGWLGLDLAYGVYIRAVAESARICIQKRIPYRPEGAKLDSYQDLYHHLNKIKPIGIISAVTKTKYRNRISKMT